MSHPTIFLVAVRVVAITVPAQGPVNSDVRKQIRLVRYQSEKISASYQVQGFGENRLRNGPPTYFSCGFVRFFASVGWFRDRNHFKKNGKQCVI